LILEDPHAQQQILRLRRRRRSRQIGSTAANLWVYRRWWWWQVNFWQLLPWLRSIIHMVPRIWFTTDSV